MSFQLLLEDRQGSSIPDGGGKIHQPGMVNENALESYFEPLCDGTTRHRSLADLRLLESTVWSLSVLVCTVAVVDAAFSVSS